MNSISLERTTRYDEIVKHEHRHRVNERDIYIAPRKTIKRRFKAVFHLTKQVLRTYCTRDPAILPRGGNWMCNENQDEKRGDDRYYKRVATDPLCLPERQIRSDSRKRRATWSVVDVILGSRESSVGIFKKAETWSGVSGLARTVPYSTWHKSHGAPHARCRLRCFRSFFRGGSVEK